MPNNTKIGATLGPATVERSQADRELSDFLRRKQPITDGMVGANDIARAVLFLLNGAAKPTTGEVLTVDAGWGVTGDR